MTGWPWPLDAVQAWFEGLWTWIEDSARIAVQPVQTWINDSARWLFDQMTAVGGWLWDQFRQVSAEISKIVSEIGPAVYTAVSSAVAAIGQGATAGFTWIWDQLVSIGSWITGTIWRWIDGALRWATDTFRWLQVQITDTGSWVVDQVSKGFDRVVDDVKVMFDGAVSGLGDVLTSVLGPVVTSLTDLTTRIVPAVSDVAKFVSDEALRPLYVGLDWLWTWISGSVSEAFTWVRDQVAAVSKAIAEGDPAPAFALLTGFTGLGLAASGIMSVAGTKILGTGIEVGEIGKYIGDLLNPSMLTGIVLGSLLTVAVRDPLTQLYRRQFRTTIPDVDDATRMLWRGVLDEPGFREVVGKHGFGGSYEEGLLELTRLIPGAGDLITFVVREVISPDDFNTFMAKQGFEAFWSKAYWDAHWVLPAADMLYTAYHRGVISQDELNKFVVWHDYSPSPRPGIDKSDLEIMAGIRKTLIPRVDLRRGWELGAISDEQLLRRYEFLGYEDDAPLMAEIQKRVALDAEIGKIRDNSKKDFVEGFIDEATLRADLASLGYSSALIDFHVRDALGDRDRAYKLDLVSYYVDSYLKDLITEEECRTYLSAIIVIPEVVNLVMDRAYVKKYSKPRK